MYMVMIQKSINVLEESRGKSSQHRVWQWFLKYTKDIRNKRKNRSTRQHKNDKLVYQNTINIKEQILYGSIYMMCLEQSQSSRMWLPLAGEERGSLFN
jgi:hypothetical protein